MEPVIEIGNLTFAYGREPVLRNVDLCVEKGEFLALLGPNGGGKTTLVKLMAGLLKPAAGSLAIFGQKPSRAGGRVGYVPQHTNVRPNFPVSTLEVAMMGLGRGFGLRYSARDKEKGMLALERVGLAEHSTKLLNDLSGGQKQRALIARALAGDPELLLLDEPTANIDPHARFCFYEFLSELLNDRTIVVVSHDLNVLMSRATCVATVNRDVLFNCDPTLTQEMLALIYGEHNHTCPVDGYLHHLRAQFPEFGTGENNA